MSRNEDSCSNTKFRPNKTSISSTPIKLAGIVATVGIVTSSLLFWATLPSLAKPLPSCVITQKISGGGSYRRIRVINRCTYSVRILVPRYPLRPSPQCIVLPPGQGILLTVPVGYRLAHC
jgi:hypothetical protein